MSKKLDKQSFLITTLKNLNKLFQLLKTYFQNCRIKGLDGNKILIRLKNRSDNIQLALSLQQVSQHI